MLMGNLRPCSDSSTTSFSLLGSSVNGEKLKLAFGEDFRKKLLDYSAISSSTLLLSVFWPFFIRYGRFYEDLRCKLEQATGSEIQFFHASKHGTYYMRFYAPPSERFETCNAA